MSTPLNEQELLIKETRALFAERYEPYAERHKACLFWAYSFIEVCNRHFIHAILQAGSAKWQCLHPDSPDDGVQPNSFGYEFHIEEAVQHIRNGNLPEIHVWAAIPDRNELIDLSTGFQPQQMLEITGRKWDEKILPPQTLWLMLDDQRESEDGLWLYAYEPQAAATMLSASILNKFHKEKLGFPYFLFKK